MSASTAHVRLPAVAGRFYPASPTGLTDPGTAIAVVDRDLDVRVVPATAMLAYARTASAAAAELVSYATSGDAFGDMSRVVGYAGVVVR